MLHQIITKVTKDSIQERAAGKKIVLLYPRTNYRNVFLSHYMENATEGLLYFRLNNNTSSIREWLESMMAEFDSVLGGFGQNLRAAFETGNAAAMGEALAKDLAGYSDGDVILYVDELDRVPFDIDFNGFISALVSTMRDNHQIVVSSRMLPRQPWYDLIESGDAVIMGREHLKDDATFATGRDGKPHLEVYACGGGHALINGYEINNWDGALPRNLFFYFIDNTLVTRDDIFATFWPQLNIKEATNVFHVTKRKISERLSVWLPVGVDVELTKYGSGFYTPSDNLIRFYDVTDFQQAAELALTLSDEEEQEQLFIQAIDLYRAPFLEEVDMPWAVERREHLQQLYTQILTGMAGISHKRGETERALSYYNRALRNDLTREDIHHNIMQAYVDLGQPERAREQYQHLSQILETEFNIQPSQRSQKLYKSISD